MPEISLIDGRTVDMMSWFRNLFVDATSFMFYDKKVICVNADLRELTLSMINVIIETLKLNGYNINESMLQIRPKSTTSFNIYLLINKKDE